MDKIVFKSEDTFSGIIGTTFEVEQLNFEENLIIGSSLNSNDEKLEVEINEFPSNDGKFKAGSEDFEVVVESLKSTVTLETTD